VSESGEDENLGKPRAGSRRLATDAVVGPLTQSKQLSGKFFFFFLEISFSVRFVGLG
jgi:hypothetical protein